MARIVVSRLSSPHLNLAMETALFKALPANERLLFLYSNDPCVVIGRNQNPWKEVNLKAAKDRGVPVIRRRSGGGTVVHDNGNVNFCAQGPRSEFSRTDYLDLIVEALNKQSPGLLKINDRHDIVNAENEKVSGSSYKIEREKAYHHATMLLSTNLAALKAILKRPVQYGTIEGLGTDSVRSPVANAAGVSQLHYINTWIAAYQQKFGASLEMFTEKNVTEEMRADADVLRSWQWTFGETPRFTHNIGDQEFKVYKGLIEEGPQESIGKPYTRDNVPASFVEAVDP